MADHQTSIREPQIHGNKNLNDVTNEVCNIMDRKPTWLWWLGITLSLSALTFMPLCKPCTVSSVISPSLMVFLIRIAFLRVSQPRI